MENQVHFKGHFFSIKKRKMIFFKTVYQFSFYFVVLLTFLIGGPLQFFIGVSNTGLTYIILILMSATYFLYVGVYQKLLLHRVFLMGLIFFAHILLSGIVNQSQITSTLIYSLFALLPLTTFLFCYINYKQKFISHQQIFKVFHFIGLIQLPIILVQRYFYDSLISLNNSSQQIASFDFLFGSFFLKSDHSMSFFLLSLVASIFLNRRNKSLKIKFPLISVLYFSTTIFLSESNISKLFISILLGIYFIEPIYFLFKKSPLIKIVTLITIFLGVLFIYGLREKEMITNKIGGKFDNQYTLKVSERQYELGKAKRGQIIIVAANKRSHSFFGSGPYSYFDIMSGKFSKNKHFSQLIWTYFDLGLLGLLIAVFYFLSIISFLDIPRGFFYAFFLSILLGYSIYTTFFSDIAILFTLLMTFNKKKNEFNSSAIS